LAARSDITQEEIEGAIVACLRIFAARGRQLRLEREQVKADGIQTDEATAGRKTGGNGQDNAAETPASIDAANEDYAPVNTDASLSAPSE
jgi:hypothetical protein